MLLLDSVGLSLNVEKSEKRTIFESVIVVRFRQRADIQRPIKGLIIVG